MLVQLRGEGVGGSPFFIAIGAGPTLTFTPTLTLTLPLTLPLALALALPLTRRGAHGRRAVLPSLGRRRAAWLGLGSGLV